MLEVYGTALAGFLVPFGPIGVGRESPADGVVLTFADVLAVSPIGLGALAKSLAEGTTGRSPGVPRATVDWDTS